MVAEYRYGRHIQGGHMDFGLHIGTRGPGATSEGLKAIAQKCEASGFTTLGFNDHVITANVVDSKYPYSETGIWPAADTGTCLDQLMTIESSRHRNRL